MLRAMLDWLEARTGYRRFRQPFVSRTLPHGPSWGYTTASCLLWLFVVQVVTGLLLMATYSPSTTTAWASVHYIERLSGGRFLRGVHYFAAQAMIVLVLVHIGRVLLTAAFRAPRELIWITGLLLVPLTLGWAITGNPLSGSQEGMAQIEVEGNIIGSTPVVGPYLQRILIGGPTVGNLTLTHLYFLHVGLLPILVIALLIVHISQIYRHGLTMVRRDGGTGANCGVPYWPHQTVRNMLVLAVLLGGIGWAAWRIGAPLGVPADPELPHTPRPEWYFLWLFELRRYFTGEHEYIATLVIPLATFVFLLAVPLIDTFWSQGASTVFRTGIVVLGLGAWTVLTVAPLWRDWHDEDYLRSRQEEALLAQRAVALADHFGVPPEGAAALLRNDPKTQGPRLFHRHCAVCHPHTDAQGEGIPADEPSAANLYRFGSREWIAGLLDPETIAGDAYFGRTALADRDMVSTITGLFEDAAAEGDEAVAQLREKLDKVAAALAAEAARPDRPTDSTSAEDVARGRELIVGELGCTDCHKFHDEGELGMAPDLTGYGSREWLRAMVSNPAHERFYPEDLNDRMPAFLEDPHRPEVNILTGREVDLLVDWLRGDWYEPDTDDSATDDSAAATDSGASR